MQTILRNLLKLTVAGILIGTLHAQDALVALILAAYAGYTLGKKFLSGSADRGIFLAGFLISSVFGVLCELWGIHFGHWEYHDLSGSRQFPFWLPFAWGLAFTYIYGIERDLVLCLRIHTLFGKVILALLVAMVFPTIGEMITIYLGVWTYNWPYQILGVPLLAILLLMVFHSGVNLLMGIICKKMDWVDPVFHVETKAME
ncbi:hypothetical protein [Lunatimonas lonarensis]|nr:hypothetical protein [Lunatimonas lonarensis]